MSASRPDFLTMRMWYEFYRSDSRPCKAGVVNQCAVRMSLALFKSGFNFGTFPDQKRIHSGRKECKLDKLPHILGADELHQYLKQVWDAGEMGKGAKIREDIKGRTGIVYFNNCFKRKSTDKTKVGDHIDLWNGEQYYNQILGIGAGGNAKASSDLFNLAGYVRFFGLE